MNIVVITVSSIIALAVLLQGTEARVIDSSHYSQLRIIALHENKENFKQNMCGAPKPELHYIGKLCFSIVPICTR